MLSHLGPIFGGFVLPLVMFLVAKDKQPYVRHHACEALNFAITLFVASLARDGGALRRPDRAARPGVTPASASGSPRDSGCS